MKKTLQLKGLDCAACAGELEEEIAATAGVSFVSVTFVNQKLTVEYDTEETLALVKHKANHFEEVEVVEETSIADGGRLGGRKNSFTSGKPALRGLCHGS